MLVTDFIPASQRESRRLMVVLHGLGDSMEGYRWLPEAMGLPWLNYLLVNAPDEYYGGYSWYDLHGDADAGVRRSRALLFELLERQVGAGFAAETTYMFGFSQGCLMSLEVVGRYPRRLAGVVGVSGYVHQPELLAKELSPVAREQRMLFTHGTNDPLIPCQAVRRQVEHLKSAGMNITWREFAKVHTIAGEEELKVIRDFVAAGVSNPSLS